jgi:hypothetical protein
MSKREKERAGFWNRKKGLFAFSEKSNSVHFCYVLEA